MSTLTAIEQAVLAAIDNEAETAREEGMAERNAWNNAALYCDGTGIEVAIFRATITKLTGFKF